LKSKRNHTALLVFSRSAQAEATAKQLLFSPQKAESMAALMIENTRKTVQNSDLPYYFITEKQQKGSSFGEKLSNAIESIFSKGYENVIAIGNDCLALTPLLLQQASELLQATPSVLGHSTDGGVYLMGFQKAAFSRLKQDFLNIDWQTENVFSQLSILTKNTVLCPILSDIDTVSDLKKAIKNIPLRLQKAILYIISILKTTVEKPVSTFVLKVYLSLKSLRAPPAY
jgi:uncharacterized protein